MNNDDTVKTTIDRAETTATILYNLVKAGVIYAHEIVPELKKFNEMTTDDLAANLVVSHQLLDAATKAGQV